MILIFTYLATLLCPLFSFNNSWVGSFPHVISSENTVLISYF